MKVIPIEDVAPAANVTASMLPRLRSPQELQVALRAVEEEVAPWRAVVVRYIAAMPGPFVVLHEDGTYETIYVPSPPVQQLLDTIAAVRRASLVMHGFEVQA